MDNTTDIGYSMIPGLHLRQYTPSSPSSTIHLGHMREDTIDDNLELKSYSCPLAVDKGEFQQRVLICTLGYTSEFANGGGTIREKKLSK